MFLKYYGLREQPFSMTPDPRYLYMSAAHREALASLIYGVETGRGFMSLIAEPGMGKTTLLFQFLERFRNSARTAFLFQTQGNTQEFLSNLISDLGVDPDDRDLSSLQRQLNEILIHEARLGRQFVLAIDEAQNLDDSVLESVRMLSNFETSRSKLMQIVLAGQPPLADKLAQPELEQLMQRVSIICRLKPFSRQEVVSYIEHRLRTAGCEGGLRFTTDALTMIANLSGGIPRNINNICFHALSLGYAKGQKKIDRTIIQEVSLDLELETHKNTRPRQHPVQQEPQVKTPDFERVILNDSARMPGERVIFRGGRNSSPASYGFAGRGRPRRHTSRLAFWAVSFLMMAFAAEFIWAYLPPGTRDRAVTELVTTAIDKAKEVASNYGPLKTGSLTESKQAQTTVIHSDADSNEIPKPLRADINGTPAPANDNSGKADSPAAGAQESTASESAAASLHATAPFTPNPTKAAPQQAMASTGADSPVYEPGQKGKIVVESNIQGGSITINGESKPGWVTPHIFDLAPGVYRISVTQEGYSTWYRVVRVTTGHKQWVTADLHPPRGVVVIDTEPAGLQVYIDGKAYGPSEVEAALSAGEHQFKVVPPGGRRPFEGSFVLKPGDVLTRKVRWMHSGSPSAVNKQNSKELRNKRNSVKEKEQS